MNEVPEPTNKNIKNIVQKIVVTYKDGTNGSLMLFMPIQ
jgi:hypothetical protein